MDDKGTSIKPDVSGAGATENPNMCKRCGFRPKVNTEHMKLEICGACFTSNA